MADRQWSARRILNKHTPRLIKLICITVSACGLVPTSATAQQIVKWTDDQGQIHFSDHAPPGQNATNVVVQKAPKSTAPSTAVRPQTQGNSYVSGAGAASAPASDSEAARRAAAEKEQQRRWDEQNKAAAAARLKADKDLIAQCKANRETYCNQSADAIRKQEHMIAEMQYLDAVNHHQDLADRGISSPAPRPPPPLNNTSN
jgi:Domain of unknown function (DUF4124)